jgi:regulator of protease activity HflC (stomatin/prohibitin superfamily)
MNIASLVKGISLVFWLVVIAVTVLIILQAARKSPVRKGGFIILGMVLAAVLISTLSAGLVYIQPDQRGVVITAAAPGYRQEALPPGIHWVIPFAENVILYPISRQTYTMSAVGTEGQQQGDDSITARTSDGQEVFIDASVIYSIDPTKVVQLHIQWQDRYQDQLVRAQARGIIRSSVSKYNVEEVYSLKRTDLVQDITTTLKSKMADNGLILVDFVLRNITFSKEYSASIEQKQIAQQQAEQAKFTVEQKKQEAEQVRQTAQGQADAAVIKAKGDAEARLVQADAEAKALQMIAIVLKDNPNMLNYQYITKLSPSIQTILVPSNSPFMLPFPTSLNGAGAATTTTTP